MPHVLFIDGNRQVFNAMNTAIEMGSDVSFIYQLEHPMIPNCTESEPAQAILPRLHKCISVQSTADPEEVASITQSINASLRVDAIICMYDFAMLPAAAAARALGLHFEEVEVLEAILNKGKMRKLLDHSNVRNAKSRSVSTFEEIAKAADDIGYPVFIKPTKSTTSIGAVSVFHPEDLREAYQFLRRSIMEASIPALRENLNFVTVEERLDGRMFTVELALSADRKQVFMITEIYRSEISETAQIGMSTPAAISENTWKLIENYVIDVVHALGIRFGILHVEIILRHDGPVVIEINPRMMGATMPTVYRAATDHDPFDAMVNLHLGRPFYFPDPSTSTTMFVLSLRSKGRSVMPEPDVLCNFIETAHTGEFISLTNTAAENQLLNIGDVIGRLEIHPRTPSGALTLANDLISLVENRFSLPIIRPI